MDTENRAAELQASIDRLELVIARLLSIVQNPRSRPREVTSASRVLNASQKLVAELRERLAESQNRFAAIHERLVNRN
jgi:nitrate reductase assembly molybdenum cofactor insertion protein NarJ